MKMISASALVLAATVAPLAYSSGTLEDVESVVQAGQDHGVTHFENIEFDEGGNERIEIEGWLDGGWFVEVDMDTDGSVVQEERSKRSDGPRGLTPDEVRDYANAASTEGIVQFDEIDVNSSGRIEIEGDDAGGHDLEIDFQAGSLQPTRVDRED